MSKLSLAPLKDFYEVLSGSRSFKPTFEAGEGTEYNVISRCMDTADVQRMTISDPLEASLAGLIQRYPSLRKKQGPDSLRRNLFRSAVERFRDLYLRERYYSPHILFPHDWACKRDEEGLHLIFLKKERVEMVDRGEIICAPMTYNNCFGANSLLSGLFLRLKEILTQVNLITETQVPICRLIETEEGADDILLCDVVHPTIAGLYRLCGEIQNEYSRNSGKETPLYDVFMEAARGLVVDLFLLTAIEIDPKSELAALFVHFLSEKKPIGLMCSSPAQGATVSLML